jgi:hypothetical protein
LEGVDPYVGRRDPADPFKNPLNPPANALREVVGTSHERSDVPSAPRFGLGRRPGGVFRCAMAKARRTTKAGVTVASHDAADKLMACLNHGRTQGPDYKRERNYFSACARWWNGLTPAQRETALVVIDAYTHTHRDAAERMAAELPAAPACPF